MNLNVLVLFDAKTQNLRSIRRDRSRGRAVRSRRRLLGRRAVVALGGLIALLLRIAVGLVRLFCLVVFVLLTFLVVILFLLLSVGLLVFLLRGLVTVLLLRLVFFLRSQGGRAVLGLALIVQFARVNGKKGMPRPFSRIEADTCFFLPFRGILDE